MGLIPASCSGLRLRSTGTTHAPSTPCLVICPSMSVAWHLGDCQAMHILATDLAANIIGHMAIVVSRSADSDEKSSLACREIDPASWACGEVEPHHRASRRTVGRRAGARSVGQPHRLPSTAIEFVKVIREWLPERLLPDRH